MEGERPTARAISERLFKIRAQAKTNGTAAHFTMTSASGGGKPTGGGTPRKPKAAKHEDGAVSANKTAAGTPSKRKRTVKDDDEGYVTGTTGAGAGGQASREETASSVEVPAADRVTDPVTPTKSVRVKREPLASFGSDDAPGEIASYDGSFDAMGPAVFSFSKDYC